MISINDYLDNILNEFNYYLINAPYLCKLKTVNFDAGQLPEYNDIHVQQLYLLRYAYAYAFEYKVMYMNLLTHFDFDSQIKVTSIGCGNMIDYWSLTRALKELGKKSYTIYYVGIDTIDWNYKMPFRDKDNVQFGLGDAIQALEQADCLRAEVYFFPKSISEFTDEQMERMCYCFQVKNIIPTKLHIMISLRSDGYSMERDQAKAEKIICAITSNGYKTEDVSTKYWYINSEETKIRKLDSEFEHPSSVIQTLKELNEQCNQYKMESENCETDCKTRLSRWPILNSDKVKYQIITFERRN